MAMRREAEVQGDLVVTWAEMPRSPGHAFYDRLQTLLIEAGFDGFVETTCKPFYAPRLGAPWLPPGRYFRMHMIGYFEGVDSERGIAWRCSDSLSLRAFLRLGSRDKVADHSWLSKTRSRLPKGRGSWAFEFNGREPVFAPSMTYGDAKKWIKEHIRSEAPADFKGCVVVNVCP